ncbi:MAG: hypothetical protein LBH32_10490 [Dysgonamonadaceae bacterium]|jgi:hypothetical protein|nr:hypothetical protein [Dysgonamonadaceae bacterium]
MIRYICVEILNKEMPMYQKITQTKFIDCYRVMEKEDVLDTLNPKKKTLTLIMQFASAYHVEKALPASLAGMVLN